MKTILVLTDFSISADYAAHYALKLAQKIKANLLVCNIYKIPAAEQAASGNSWPLPTCQADSVNDLAELVARLDTSFTEQETEGNFRPEIGQCSEQGRASRKLKDIILKHDVLFAVISAHNRGNLTYYFGRDQAWEIIDNAACPVLVIPYQTRFKPFKRIAFATAMKDTDPGVLDSLTRLAKYSDAEILITNVTSDKKEKRTMRQFFNQCHYSKIFYRDIMGFNVADCLKRLTDQIEIDLLVMVHARGNLLQQITGGGITRKMAYHPSRPLLIYPCSTMAETLRAF